MTNIENIERFSNAIQLAGITPPADIEADGRLHRFSTSGKTNDKAGWYVLYPDGVMAGAFGCWRNDINQTWCSRDYKTFSQAEKEEYGVRLIQIRAERERDEKQRHEGACQRASQIWEKSNQVTSHPYLTNKQVKAYDIREYKGSLVVPVCDEGVIQSLQFIKANGFKRFLTGSRKKNCYFTIGKVTNVICICEGYATAASIYEATEYMTTVAFNTGNLKAVGSIIKERFPDAKLIFCADDDAWTDGNPGLNNAKEAASAVGGYVAVPSFGDERQEGMTDFNDLHSSRGINMVRQQIMQVISNETEQWSEPEEIIAEELESQYPINFLPESIRNVVLEVAGAVQCPIPLVACNALAVISIAAQGLANVVVTPQLQFPISLWFMVVAESGERKSHSERKFRSSLEYWERAMREEFESIIGNYKTQMETWASEKDGLIARLKAAGKKSKRDMNAEVRLAELNNSKPIEPVIPMVMVGDATPEALASELAIGWRSRGILSSEGATILGSHGMGKDSVLRNLGGYNIYWDGEGQKIHRKTSENIHIKNVRFTMLLEAQLEVVLAFMNANNKLADNIGFLPRFLFARPKSLQGNRKFKETPDELPSFDAFNKRIVEILWQSVRRDFHGIPIKELSPKNLYLSKEAKELYEKFYNDIEEQLGKHGNLAGVRGYANKMAENAGRIAGNLHIFCENLLSNNKTEIISGEIMNSACMIAAWHLMEIKNFNDRFNLPTDIADAVNIEEFLIGKCKESNSNKIPAGLILQFGPSPTRNSESRDKALKILEETYRARVLKEGKKLFVLVNPKLLEEKDAV